MKLFGKSYRMGFRPEHVIGDRKFCATMVDGEKYGVGSIGGVIDCEFC